MKKLLIITDSLGLPRNTPEFVNYEETWVHKLKDFFNVYYVCLGGATIKDLYQQIEYSKMFNADFVVIQSGIVDCAPRALTKFENELFNKFWITRTFLDYWLNGKKLKYLRQKRNVSYTKIKVFEYYINEIKKAFEDKLFWIEILNSGIEYEKKLPGIIENVEKYNSIIKNVIGLNNFIEISKIPQSGIMTDNIHLNTQGHEYLFNKVFNKLNEKQ